MSSNRVLARSVRRELQGEDAPLFDQRGDVAIPPTKEQAARLRGQLERVADHLAAAHRIVPGLEQLQKKELLTMSLITAGRHYAVLAYVADGPSVGIANYSGDHVYSNPYNRMPTSDNRMQARRLFEAARFQAFGVVTKTGERIVDEQLRHAVEPVILGDAAAWAPGEIGRWMSGYTDKRMVNAAGVTEIRAVLRRLRSFFQIEGQD